MIDHDKPERRAREILEYYTNNISTKFNDSIESIILVGSLSNGGYVEGLGRDIDIITVLKDTSNKKIRDSILEETNNIEKQFNNDLPISRTIYNLSELKRPFKIDMELSLENKHLIEMTTELQRMHESGILLYGKNIIGEMPIPTRNEVMFFDKSCSNKHEIASRMKKDVTNYKYHRGLELATKYKINPNIELIQSEYDEMKKEYKELAKWKDTHPVDSVPLLV